MLPHHLPIHRELSVVRHSWYACENRGGVTELVVEHPTSVVDVLFGVVTGLEGHDDLEVSVDSVPTGMMRFSVHQVLVLNVNLGLLHPDGEASVYERQVNFAD